MEEIGSTDRKVMEVVVVGWYLVEEVKKRGDGTIVTMKAISSDEGDGTGGSFLIADVGLGY